MNISTFSRVRVRTAALATVATLATLTQALAQPMGPAPDPRSFGYSARDAAPTAYEADRRGDSDYRGDGYRGDPGYGAYDRNRGPHRHRRARAHPVHPRPECELGLHGCLGRDGLYHGKF